MCQRSTSLALIVMLLTVVGIVLFLELILRLFPVNEGLRSMAVTENSPIFRYTPHRKSIWSKGWNFSIVNEVHTNNFGFISEIDCDPAAPGPLLAIVGDSYIEAAMVPHHETATALLNKELVGKGRVYGFGASGSALSQYLAYAEYVRDIFHPEALVVLVVGNDFDESLLRYKSVPGFHYFAEQASGELRLIRIDREVPPWREVFTRSSLAMYLAANLEIGHVLERVKELVQSSPSRVGGYVGNTSASADPVRIAESLRGVDAFINMLPVKAGLLPRKILLVIDAVRPEMYDPAARQDAESTYFGLMRRHFLAKATAAGFEVIDMETEFREDHTVTGRRYEYPTDTHWNNAGHEVFARALQRSAVYRSFYAAAQ